MQQSKTVPDDCTCWQQPPTVPVFRDPANHLDGCPLKGTDWPVGTVKAETIRRGIGSTPGVPTVCFLSSILGSVRCGRAIADHELIQATTGDWFMVTCTQCKWLIVNDAKPKAMRRPEGDCPGCSDTGGYCGD